MEDAYGEEAKDHTQVDSCVKKKERGNERTARQQKRMSVCTSIGWDVS